MVQKLIFFLAALSAHIQNFIRFNLPGGHVIWPYIDVWLLLLCDASRLFCAGAVAEGALQSRRPQKPLILYEFEACPFCRRVREALCVLHIDYVCYPCPRETLKQRGQTMNSKYRPYVQQASGQLCFPYLEDPNTERKMTESADIIRYLWSQYGDKATPSMAYKIANHPLVFRWSMIVFQLLRPSVDMGCLRAPAHKAEKPIEFWGYESSCYCRRVREKLSMLEIPYMYHMMPRGSPKRPQFRQDYSKDFSMKCARNFLQSCQVPFIKDPNGNVSMFESGDIVEYLKTRFQTAPPPNESWLDYGCNDKKTA